MAQTIAVILKQLLRIYLLLSLLQTMTEGKRCTYKMMPKKPQLNMGKTFYLETEMAHKDCQWGCCWEQKEDVCCSFPMDAIVFAFIATIALIIVITLIVILLCYIHSKKTKPHNDYNGLIPSKDSDEPHLIIMP